MQQVKVGCSSAMACLILLHNPYDVLNSMSVKRQKLNSLLLSPLLHFQLQLISLQKTWLVNGQKTISGSILYALGIPEPHLWNM